jgi:hypothetical protein
MAQTVVQSGVNNFGGTSATAAVTLTNVQAGNCIEVRISAWGFNTQPDCTVSDGTNTYTLARRAQHTTVSDRHNAEIHYTFNASTASRTVTVTHPSNSGNRFGHIWVAEISGRESTDPVAASGISAVNASGTAPAVTASGATGQATMCVGVVTISDGADSSIDAASGSSLTWTNRLREQNATAEVGAAMEDAPSATSITPTVNWGTTTSAGWAAVIVAFKDAAAGGTTTNKTMTDTLAASDEPVRWSHRLRRMDEGLTVADSVVKSLLTAQIIVRVLTELIDVSEAVVRWNRRDRQHSDTLIVFDDPNRVIEMLVTDESVTIEDGTVHGARRGRTQTDSVTLEDSVVRWRRLTRILSDNLTLIDAFLSSVNSNAVHVKLLDDTLTLADDAGRRWTLRTRVPDDSLAANDETVQMRRTRRVSDDALELSDATLQSLFRDQLSPTNIRFGLGEAPFTFGTGTPPFSFGAS